MQCINARIYIYIQWASLSNDKSCQFTLQRYSVLNHKTFFYEACLCNYISMKFVRRNQRHGND